MVTISEAARTLLTIEQEQAVLQRELEHLDEERVLLERKRKEALRKAEVLLALARAVVKGV